MTDFGLSLGGGFHRAFSPSILAQACPSHITGRRVPKRRVPLSQNASIYTTVKTSFWICESNMHDNSPSKNFWLKVQWIPEFFIMRDMLTTKNHMLLSRIACCFQLSNLGQDYQIIPAGIISIFKCIEKWLAKAFSFILACNALLNLYLNIQTFKILQIYNGKGIRNKHSNIDFN